MADKDDVTQTQEAYKRLFETIKILRAPGGCPWDRDQTPLSMRRDLIEEAFEAVDAITQEDASHACEELGDVMLNATMIAYMYEQAGAFSVAKSLNDLTDKLIRRHPHVFPESTGKAASIGNVKDSDAVLKQWDAIKATVEGREGKSILDEVPAGFPSLLKAYKLQKKAAKKGFDWDSLEPVVGKIQEELSEVQEAVKRLDEVKASSAELMSAGQEMMPAGQKADTEKNAGTNKPAEPFTVLSSPEVNKAQKDVEGEVGDLLFAVVNYARKLGVDPDVALNATNSKFYRRFVYVESKMGENMKEKPLSEMDKYWDEAKKLEHK